MLELQCKDGNAEVWADIQNYEGRYQVSNLGRVKSLARMRRGKSGCEVPVPEIIMTLTPKKDTGRTKPYVEVKFRNGGLRTERCKSFLVHRLVAAAFIKPLEQGEQVDHINGIHGDNRVENLRVMHYTEHAKLHPTFFTETTQSLAKIGYQKKLQSGWVPGQYQRNKMHLQQLRENAALAERAGETGQFMPGPMKDEKGRPTRKAASLARWKC